MSQQLLKVIVVYIAYIVYAKLSLDVMLLHRLLVNLIIFKCTYLKYDKNLWQVHGKSYNISCYHISCAQCILGICALHFGSICGLKLRILLAIHELNLLPCSLPVVAIIVTCQIFLYYITTIINNWTPPSESIFLGAPPLLRSKILHDPPPFLPAHPQS